MTRSNRWKGGRVIATNGYVMVWEPTHRLAHSNGYVPEHRMVAEEMIGRELAPEEEIHHRNGDRRDNRPANLEVLTHAEHAARHRRRTDLRRPGAPNPTVACGCGCREWMALFDDRGRPRRVLHGHNRRALPC
jgi:hypothetical protein